jgi:small-conductance mechanosensitive channel
MTVEINSLFEPIIAWLTAQAQAIFTAANLLQVGLFFIVLLAASLLTLGLKGRIAQLREQVTAQDVAAQDVAAQDVAAQDVAAQDAGGPLPWLDGLLAILSDCLWPLLAALLGSVTAAVLTESERPSDLLSWLNLFLYLLLAYRFLHAIIARRFRLERAKWLERRFLRPLILSLATLHLLGVFARLLNIGFTVSDSRVTLGGLLAGLFIFYLFAIISRESRSLLSDSVLPRAGLDPSLTQIVAMLAAYTLLVIGLLLALGVVGIPLTAFTIIAGGLSVGIGFGMQELISNFISGFILLLERSIAPGHVVQVGETFGTVEHIGIRATSIRDLTNAELIVPNSRFLNDEVINFTRSDSRVRLRVDVGVSYDADPREVEKALLSAAQHELMLVEPAPIVQFVDFGDSSLDFSLIVWTERPILRGRIASDLRYNIWYALKERGIEIPFPQRDIHIRSVSAPEGISQLVA